MKRLIVGLAVALFACAAVLAMVSVPQVGLAEQPLEPFVAVAQTQGSLGGVSWTAVTEPSPSVGHQVPTVFGQHRSASNHAEHVSAWLDLHGGRSRAVNREPDLLRYEF